MEAVYTDQEYISASAWTTGKSDLYGKERYLHSSAMTTMFFSIAAELSKRGVSDRIETYHCLHAN